MRNKPLIKLRQNELNDFCQLTTFSPAEIRIQNRILIKKQDIFCSCRRMTPMFS